MFDCDPRSHHLGPTAGEGRRLRAHDAGGPGPGQFRGFGMHGFGGPFGGPFGGRFGGRGRLARRGDIRAAILALLADRPMHGYQVIQELEARSGGRLRPSAGSVYPTLQQLEDEGLVRSEEHDGRRVFTLTAAGREESARRGATPARPWDPSRDAADDDAFELRDLIFQVAAAAMQVVGVGAPGAASQAREILVDTRRRLYRLLAEGDEGAGNATQAASPATSTEE